MLNYTRMKAGGLLLAVLMMAVCFALMAPSSMAIDFSQPYASLDQSTFGQVSKPVTATQAGMTESIIYITAEDRYDVSIAMIADEGEMAMNPVVNTPVTATDLPTATTASPLHQRC